METRSRTGGGEWRRDLWFVGISRMRGYDGVGMEAFVVFVGMDSRWHCEAAFQGVVEVLLDDFVRFRSVDDRELYIF